MSAVTTEFSLVDLSDEKTFESVFHSHYSALVIFCRQYVQDYEQSEEIVQDTFAALWSKADTIDIRTNLKSYLFGAVRNAALNYLKHQKVVKAHKDYVTYSGSILDTTDIVELDELHNHVDEALGKLPEKCREVFELNRFQGKKYREIAEELGLSMKTVENQMGKALKIMREELAQYLPIILILFLLRGGK